MKTINLMIIAGVLSLSRSAIAQNQYSISQYMLYPTFINPAAISNENQVNAAIFHRAQWLGIPGSPTTQGLAVNLPFKDTKNTIGLMLLHDKIGVNNSTQVSAGYAHKLKLNNRVNLSFGLNALINITQSNYANLEDGDVYDPVFSGNTSPLIMPNFKYGMYLTSSKFYAGFSMPNLLENKIVSTNKSETKFNAQNLNYYLQAGYLFQLDPKNAIGVSTFIKEASGSPIQIDINTQFIYDKKLGIGLSYRTSQELVGLVNYQITQKLKAGYAYDLNMSKLSKYTSGSHEIMLIFSMVNTKVPVNFFNPRF